MKKNKNLKDNSKILKGFMFINIQISEVFINLTSLFLINTILCYENTI